MENKTFDARGMACPLPVVNAKKESEEMTNGGTLIILVDNEIAVQNLTKFGNSKGFTVSSEKKTEKDFTVTFRFRKTAQPQHQQLNLPFPPAPRIPRNMVL